MSKRKFLAGILILLVLPLALAGCGGEEEMAPQETETAEEAQPQFETIEEGVLTIGSDIPFPPFEFRQGGELTGFDVELMEEMARRLELEPRWVDTSFETIFTQLAAGRFDAIASATTITEERDRLINFSEPYYRAQQALIVNAEETPDIQSVDDLGDGDIAAVQRGTTGEMWARENLEPQGVEIRSFPEAPDTYIALDAGNVTAVVFDEPSAVEEAERRPTLEVVDTMDTGEEYGFGVNPQNEELLDAVNSALDEAVQDGTYCEIYGKWFPEAPAGAVTDC